MNFTKYNINSDIQDNKIEFEENKLLLWLEKFCQFSLLYGDYLAGLHSKKSTK